MVVPLTEPSIACLQKRPPVPLVHILIPRKREKASAETGKGPARMTTTGRFTEGTGSSLGSRFHGYLWPHPDHVDDALFIRGSACRIHPHHPTDALSISIHASATMQLAERRLSAPDIGHRDDFYLSHRHPTTIPPYLPILPCLSNPAAS